MNRTAVEEIKARLPIEEIVGAYTKLEKSGKSWKARCPFHNEKTASFFVSPDRGGYYCFGCGAKGDIFTFVEQFEGLDFRGALKVLAEKAGVKLTFDQKTDNERDRMYEVIDEASKYYEDQIEKNELALEYTKKRGITDQTRKLFRIGFAPLGWRNIETYLKRKGFDEQIIEKVGLIKKKDGGQGFYDRFRGRIMFPINDSSGRVIAFSGRILEDDGQSAKYLNSPDTPLYDKSAVLYGLDKAKSEIRRMGYTIMVEGQMDLVMSHQAGIKNTVAASGTALTDEAVGKNGIVSNLGLIRRLSPNIIIAFDSDMAGRKAAMRAASIALSMGMDVKMADIVGGKDPADLVKEDAEKWRDVLRHAKPIIAFELDNILREISDMRKISKAVAERILPLIIRIESNSDRSHFVQLISDKTKVPADIIWQDIAVIEKRSKQENPTVTQGEVLRTSSEIIKRIDIVERRLFGILLLMEKQNISDTTVFLDRIKKLSGDSFSLRDTKARANSGDLIFEAETFFGTNPQEWKRHAEELLINFEEDLVGEELIETMQKLKSAEAAGDSALLGELAKKCQVLSIRKAEIGKKRRK